MLEESIEKNIALANLPIISKNHVLDRKKERDLVTKGIKELHIRCFGPFHECNNLSGGNQQKVVFAKWVYTQPKVLILDEPTRGVDIGAKKNIESYEIRCSGGKHPVGMLSGGNMQKVVVARECSHEPKVLIAEQPTRGVDIGAKKEIYSIINDLAAKGVAIIMVSSELPEVLGMSDRVMVVREGVVRGIIYKEEANQENIMTLATGGMI